MKKLKNKINKKLLKKKIKVLLIILVYLEEKYKYKTL